LQRITVSCEGWRFNGDITQEIPNIKAIFDQVTESNVKMCWNSNNTDLLPPGLEANFNSVKKWFGDTVHVANLIPYLSISAAHQSVYRINYNGWILLEASGSNPTDKCAMKEQLALFNQLISKGKKGIERLLAKRAKRLWGIKNSKPYSLNLEIIQAEALKAFVVESPSPLV